MAAVARTKHVLGTSDGLTTMEQRFYFVGDGVGAAAIADVLLTAPLTGSGSIFGDRPGDEGHRTASSRTLQGFSPAPGFRFDVRLVREGEGVFVVRFTQPARNNPYLQGGLVWMLADEEDGAVLDEQVNTKRALAVAGEPLTGSRPSLRRWLFFRAGHKQVMTRATSNIAVLLDRRAP
jgi:hypothetical protein